MRDILFDEKIAGSFHFTPGQAYEEADNGNRSQVHWDLVSIQRPDYGGGEIYLDGKLIRKNGEFLPKGLRSLNWRWLSDQLHPIRLRSLRSAQQIQLHHDDLAALVEIEVSDFEHWRTFGRVRAETWQLNNDLLRVRTQRDRSNLKRRRKLKRANLERHSN